MKKTVSLLLAFLFVFLMSACGVKEEETTTAKTTEAAPVTETTAPEITRTQAEIDEIIAGIKKACVLSTVLDKYGSYVLDTGYIDSGCLYYYFLKNGKIAYIAELDMLGEEFVYDIYYGDKYYKGYRGYGGRMSAYFYLGPMCLYLTPQYEEEVAAGFIDDDEKVFSPEKYSCFNLIGESEDYYYFSTDEDVTEYSTYSFDKETLLPVRVSARDQMDTQYKYGLDYGEPGSYAGTFDEYTNPTLWEEDKIIDDCLGEQRKVTVVKEYYEHGELFTDETTVEIPATWELYFNYYDGFEVYMDAEHTVEYSYPGDGVDYTLYVKISD